MQCSIHSIWRLSFVVLLGIALTAALSMRTTKLQLRMSSEEAPPTPKIPKTSFETAIGRCIPGKSWFRAKPIGIGAMAGQQVLPNSVFETLVDTNDAWIGKRTGIRSRHVIEKGSSLRQIAVESSLQALIDSGIDAKDIDLVICATSSPDDLFGDAGSIAASIGASKAAAFDLTAACSGFLFGVVTASQFIQTGTYKRVLVIGADALTRFIDWEDRGTCILFGDGAGAVILEVTENTEDAGVLGFALHSDGEGYCNLKLPYIQDFKELPNTEKTVIDQGVYGKLQMNGPEVYKFAVNQVPDVIAEALRNSGLTAGDVDWLLLHQANIRIMEHAADSLGIPMHKVIKNIQEYGNTSAGSIPLALAEAVQDGKVKKGDIIAMAGFGAGLSWGAAIIRWG